MLPSFLAEEGGYMYRVLLCVLLYVCIIEQGGNAWLSYLVVVRGQMCGGFGSFTSQLFV